MKRMLGKKPAVLDPRTPRLTAVLDQHLPTPPQACDYGQRVGGFQLWRNGDQLSNHGQTIPGLGDCTAVSVASAIAVMTANRGGKIMLTDDQAVGIYQRNGYDPTNPATDQGAVEVDVLGNWLQGYDIGRQAPDVLTGFGYVDPKNRDSVRRAISMLGGLYVGLSLPEYVMTMRGAWVVQGNTVQPVAGGHAVFLHGYDDNWLYFNTWAERLPMSWELFSLICDEAYGLLHRDWLDIHGNSPMRESFDTVAQELRAARAA